MFQKQVLIAIGLLLGAGQLSAQLSSYVDMQNQVMVWDRGMIRKIDYLPPVEMKIGRTTIPYFDNSRSFKIYYGSGVKTINAGLTNTFFTTDNLVAFLNQKSLNVFDKGNVKNLTGICDQYMISDSLIVFLDGVKSEYKVYYNGTVYPLETFMPDSTLSMMKVSDNVIAYNNFASQFKIFYGGELSVQEDYPVNSFDAGRNTVAYVDINRRFKIFHNGQTYMVEDYPPQSYSAGDNLVAYVSSDGYFRVFYGDSINTIGYFNPTYRVGDYVVAYKDPSGYFKTFYNGEITTLENYYPASYIIQYNSIAYINTANTLRMFSEGEVYDVTNADVQSWQLNYDVLKYQLGQNMFRFFYKGREY